MSGYLIGFTVYTLAMIGIILIGFVVAKKSMTQNYLSTPKNNFLTIESSLSIEPRKNIHVIKAGKERFLISADMEGSHFLARLEADNVPEYDMSDEKLADPFFNFASNIVHLTPSKNIITGIFKKLCSYTTVQSLKR